MKQMIIRKMWEILYADIEPLEVFQSAILIFVNPLNLLSVDYPETKSMIFIYIMCFACLMIGCTSIISILYDNLRFRLQVARVHWVATLSITAYILQCDILNQDLSMFFYYLVQSVFCLFVISRLFLEYRNKQKG